ncbi:hypothetical protein GCM10022225_18550 [Plantactinospora mayteni]|uniref:Integrase n=1 Tax=Plantactinospora mayteni TaxID=566021 RepID=A0ABQ4EN19_9ACTN|nr:hypothetical protein Pma05_26130 [Plantactinospora mayteni]
MTTKTLEELPANQDGIMGWSNSAMAVRYQHLTTQVRRDIAKRVGGLLWEAPKDPPDEDDQGAAGVRVPPPERQLRPKLRPQAERPVGRF